VLKIATAFWARFQRFAYHKELMHWLLRELEQTLALFNIASLLDAEGNRSMHGQAIATASPCQNPKDTAWVV